MLLKLLQNANEGKIVMHAPPPINIFEEKEEEKKNEKKQQQIRPTSLLRWAVAPKVPSRIEIC